MADKRVEKAFRPVLALILGGPIFLLGLVLLPLPIPLGIVFMVIGLAIAAGHPLVLRGLRKLRRRYPDASEKIRKLTPSMPSFIARVLRKTDTHQADTRQTAISQADARQTGVHQTNMHSNGRRPAANREPSDSP